MKVVDFRLQVIPALAGDAQDIFSGYVTIERPDGRRINVQLLPVEAARLVASLTNPLGEFVYRSGVIPEPPA